MFWIDLLIAASCSGAGMACGWAMHAMNGIAGEPITRASARKSSTPASSPTGSASPALSGPNVDAKSGKQPNNGSGAIDPQGSAESDSIASDAAADKRIDSPDVSEPTPTLQAERQRISDVAERLKSYAFAMAADVDAHQSKVQAVNHSLNQTTEASSEMISDAIQQLVKANEAMHGQLQSAQERIHEQALQIECAEQRATTDPLTGVPNRGALDQHINARHGLGCGVPTVLAMLDVDHFKKFNDDFGHLAGDEVLRVVAEMLHDRLNDHGIVARFGGEEFAVVLDDCDIEKAIPLVEEARHAISQLSIEFEDKQLHVTASSGLAQLSANDDGQCVSIEEWMKRSDDGLYQSKEAGRNCGHWMDGQTPVKIESGDQVKSTDSSKTESDAATDSPTDASGDKVQLKTDDDLSTSENEEPKDVADQSTTDEAIAKDSNPDESMSDESKSDQSKSDLGPLASLPDRKSLAESFAEMQQRAGASVTTFFMTIRCHDKSSASNMRSLLQVVRATLRNVDRLGYQDASTLLVCMPSIDQETARARGQQICRSAGSIGLSNPEGEERAVSIGVAECVSDDDFDHVVDRSIQLTQQSRNPRRDAVMFDAETVAAS